LILRKISKFDVTICQILRLKCTKFDFRWGSAPDSAREAYSAPPKSLAVFKGLASKGRAGERRRARGMGGEENEGEEEGGVKTGEGRGGEGQAPPQYFGLQPPLLHRAV